MTEVMIFADGASSGNGSTGKGGWAAIICRDSQELTISGNRINATNNQMELTAVIEAIEMLRPGERATIFSDSQYVVNGITTWVYDWMKKGWVTSSGSMVLNRDLWTRLVELTRKHKLQFKWIKGHSNFQIDSVDKLAKQRSKEL